MTKTRINPNTVHRKIKGMMRRRQYACAICLCPVWEYPALVMNRSELVCAKCSAETESGLHNHA